MKSRRGMSLVEILLALGIGSIGSMVFMHMMSRDSMTSIQLTQIKKVIGLRNRNLESVRSPIGWKNTLAVLTNNMACINPDVVSAPCAAQAPVIVGSTLRGFPFIPRDQQDNLIPADPPFSYELYWEPICSAYPCPDKAIEVRLHGILVTDDTFYQGVALNPRHYDFSIVRSPTSNTVEDACDALGGIYDPVTMTCRPPYAGQTCPGLHYVKQVDGSGNLICVPPYTGVCVGDTVLSGIDAGGNAICGPKVCDCKQEVSWTACSAACGGGTMTKIVNIISPPINGGAACDTPDTIPCNTQPCCSPNMGTACLGNVYQTWTENIVDCADPTLCQTCDYGTNRCTSAGMLSCTLPLVTCWANFDHDGFIQCDGTCLVGGCTDYTGCAGNNWIHQAADCTISVLTYDSPACFTCSWTMLGAGFGPCPPLPSGPCSPAGSQMDAGFGAPQGPGLWSGGCRRYRCDCN